MGWDRHLSNQRLVGERVEARELRGEEPHPVAESGADSAADEEKKEDEDEKEELEVRTPGNPHITAALVGAFSPRSPTS